MPARLTRTMLATTALSLLLTGCASLGGGGNKMPKPAAVAQLTGQAGTDRGRVDVFREGGGLRLEIVARGFNIGTYGMHIHAVGKCDAPDFTTAGPHWNPTGAQHGRDNPMGAHRGDLPNLVIEPGMIGRTSVTLPDAALTGDGGLLDGDGAAFVIHAAPDDLKTDPTGNSGGRVVCGVFSAG
jgi:superoxide dismutase, Cu-Zn family